MRGKKIIRTIAVSLLFMIAACVALAVEPERGIAAAQAEAARQPGQRAKRNHKPGELLVKFKAGVRANSAGAVMRAKGPSITESRQFKDLKHKRKKLKHPEAKLDRWWHVKLAEGEDLERAMAEIAADPSVDLVELNYEVHVQLTPNDPRFNELWGMHNIQQNGGLYDADIDAPEAWDLHTGDQSIVVAVIDTGVDYGHEDLADNMWINPGEIPGNGIDDDGNGYVDDIHGYDFINNDADPFDDFGHGTHCAGTIAGVGNNGIGVAGVNWNAGIMAVKFIGSGGSGPISGAIDAITYAINNGAKIMSNSWGGRGFSQAMLDAVNAANDAGILFVAAAGNSRGDNDINPIYPASYNAPNIVTVAATDYNDNKATFSCYGAQSVHLGAPGVNILSTVPTGACTMCSLSGYTRANGTSMATPHVAGAAALILARNPAQSVADLKTTLLSGVDPIPSMEGITITGGRLNIGTALAFNLEFEVAVSPASQSVLPGGAATYDVTVNSNSDLEQQVTLTPGALDPGISATLADGVLTLSAGGTATTTLTVTADSSVPRGNYAVIIDAIDGNGETISSAATSLRVLYPTYSVGVTPSLNVVAGGDGATYDIVLTAIDGYNGAVSLSTTSPDPLISLAISPTDAMLPVDGAVAATLTATTDPTTPTQTYTFTVMATDALESKTINAQIQILNTDLVMTSVTHSVSEIDVGENFTINSTIANLGTGATATQTKVSYHLSTDATITSDDTLIGSENVAAVSGNGSVDLNGTVWVPFSLQEGTYYVGAIADDTNRQPETNEINNALAATNTIQVTRNIDLVPTALHVPSGNISTGSHFTVTSAIANQGTSNPTGYFSVGYYLSTDAQITAADTKIADRRVYSLRAGAGLNLSATVYIPAGMAPGTYYLGVLVDKNDSQAEANEGNNGLAAAGARQVISDIDLVPTALHVPPGNISTGSHFTVTSAIANQGTSNPTGYFSVG
ncbi:MAG: S8 family serine peptidase, partial [Candidatus Thiodiazotropha sp. (ex Epidulcina cf. delphinae)]|nr:S8 family serine peptidase [Candidatus Thiodiazotropha sp. (ex Epidulcina cf. delphinae)]